MSHSVEEQLCVPNRCRAVETSSMNVIPYYSQVMNDMNPYYRLYGDYDRRKIQRMLYKLVTHGTVMEEGETIEDSDRNKIPLKQHQKRLVWEMKQLENNPYHFTTQGRLGFLCDEVGTGKSLTILSLIANNPKPTGGRSKKVPYINLIRQLNGNPYLPLIVDYWNSNASYKELNSTLIVVPHTIYTQWKQYIERDMNLSTFYIANKKHTQTCVERIQHWIEHPEEAPNVVLCKSTQYNHLIESIESIDPSYINYLETEPFQCDPTSVDYSISMIPEMIQHIRRSSRSIVSQLFSYRRGTESIANIAEDLRFLYEYMEGKQDGLNRVIEQSESDIGQIVESVSVPKSGILWNRVVFDEADTIPISSSRSVMARMFWYVSASSRSFIYPTTSPPPHRTGFIRNMILMQSRCYLYMQHCFFTNSSDTLRRSFPLLPVEHTKIECFTPNHIRVAYVSQLGNVIDAVNAGNTELALQLCQCEAQNSEEGLIESLKRTMNESLEEVQGKKDRLQQQLESIEESIRDIRQALTELGDISDLLNPDDISRYTELTQSLRIYVHTKTVTENTMVRHTNEEQSLTNRLESMETRLEETMVQDCPICMEPIEAGKRAIVSCCNQSFCVECILQQIAAYRNRTTPCPCPMCRATLTPSSFTVFKKENVLEHPEPSLPTKEKAFREILLRDDTKRVLLFSGHDTTFDTLQPIMESLNIQYMLLNGSDASIQKKIARWIEGKTRVLCLNANVLGAGLNLPQATDVVIYHEQIPELETQIIGRAQRPGRDPTTALRVWRLAYDTEYRTTQ